MAKKAKHPLISETLEQAFLSDIEKIGLSFEEINLTQLCDKKELIYGTPSSDTRRAIQKHFYRLRQRSLKNYQKLLKKYSIVPGPFTFHRIRDAADTPTKTSPTTADDESNKDIIEELEAAEELIESASESSISFEEDIESRQFEDLCTVGLRSPPVLHKMMTTPTRTPNRTPNRTPIRTPNRKKAPSVASYLASPVPAPTLEVNSFTEEEEDDAAYTHLDFRCQLGTKDQPFIVMANPDYPERNGPTFNICRLEEIEHKDYEHQGFHIRLSTDLPDYKEWEAFIPNPQEYPSLIPLYGRIIMFKGPSRPFWLRSFHRYHLDKKKIDCEVTKKVHEKMDTAIEGDPERHHQYHLVVFKPGTSLDNSVFSSNNSVDRNINSMKMETKDEDNDFGTKIYGMSLWWRVAEAGGTRIRNTNGRVNARNLLD
jgi:hypothetical protein